MRDLMCGEKALALFAPPSGSLKDAAFEAHIKSRTKNEQN